ncbi:hypothetical protein Elgi_36580 [Paenibacillus elgii]|uniref:hypothetical protein n=1 Tax=Paenibacillus elgii TaxID=189691 RepID=UPI002D7DE0C1|nr:hypothetical protein Elgi_36580 [Paenibacillus elgii]
MGQAIVKISELGVESFITGTNNNYLVFKVIPYAKQSSSGTDNIYSFNGITASEIIEADLDVALTGNNYAFSVGTDNKIKLAFAKTLHSTKAAAIEALKNVEVTYVQGNLKPDGSNYTLIARNSLGEEVHRTTPATLDKIVTIISTLVDTRDVDVDGTIEFRVLKNYINS